MSDDLGRAPSGSGSRPSDRAAERPAPTGFDPSRGDLAAMVDALQGAHIDMGQPWHWDMDQATALARVALATRSDVTWHPISTAPGDRDFLAGVYTRQGRWRQAVIALAAGIYWDWPYAELPSHWAETPPPPASGIAARSDTTQSGVADRQEPAPKGTPNTPP